MSKAKYCYCKNTYAVDCKTKNSKCKAPYYWEFYTSLSGNTQEEE